MKLLHWLFGSFFDIWFLYPDFCGCVFVILINLYTSPWGIVLVVCSQLILSFLLVYFSPCSFYFQTFLLAPLFCLYLDFLWLYSSLLTFDPCISGYQCSICNVILICFNPGVFVYHFAAPLLPYITTMPHLVD